MINADTIFFAILGGILPALIWLVFWLIEDSKHPEPKGLILKTFIIGMCAVILVLPFQKIAYDILSSMTLWTMVVLVTFEEIFKFAAGYLGGIRSREDNEPIDPLVYMITAALGFVALENVLFLVGPLVGDGVTLSTFVITGNLRFMGASLLHVVSSGIIGATLSLTFYKPLQEKKLAILLAIIGAIAFHTGFNVAVLYWESVGVIFAFLAVWLGVITLLLTFEKIKAIALK